MECKICGYMINGGPARKNICSSCLQDGKEKERMTVSEIRYKWSKKLKIKDRLRITCESWETKEKVKRTVEVVGIFPSIITINRGMYLESYTYAEFEEMKARRVNE